MSCRANIDPYNNAPPSNGGKCGMNGPISGPQTFANAYAVPQQQQQQRTGPMSRRPEQNGLSEVDMLKSDLRTAIQYIYSLGGSWPPPGH